MARDSVLSEGLGPVDVAEALVRLREGISTGTVASARTPGDSDVKNVGWELQEPAFVSRVPVVGPVISYFRTLWGSVASKWAIQSLIAQQNAINTQLVRDMTRLGDELRSAEEIIVSVDRESQNGQRRLFRYLYHLMGERESARACPDGSHQGSSADDVVPLV
jgi:hypothetical protein